MSPKHPQKRAIVLLSGGLDSTLCLAEMHASHEVVLALTFHYGQKAFSQELKAAQALCQHYQVAHQVVDLPWYHNLLPEFMQAEKNVDWQAIAESANDLYDAKPVWVPNRNGVLLNIAAAFAEAHQANCVVFGANAEEGERFPDNTEHYRNNVTQALADSTLNHVEVVCPVVEMTKPQMVERAKTLNVPLHLVWSCYSDGPEHCGFCPSCVRLKNALGTLPEKGSELQNIC